MDKLRFWINRYFGFSRRETNGFFLLLLLMMVAAVAPYVWYTGAPPAADAGREQAALDSLAALLAKTARQQGAAQAAAATFPRLPLRKFNPNALSQQQWRQLGLSSYAAGNILKYRARAGGFRYKEQLARIYGMPPELYRRLAPFIDLPSRAAARPRRAANRYSRFYASGPRRVREPLQAFDINTADTTQLKKIRGIGSRLSMRIVRFRDKLGGFAHPDQLGEVYGLPPEVIDSLRKYVFIQEGFTPQQISVNTALLAELQAHPYLGYQTGRLILAYRTQHGPFQSLEDLLKIRQISESQFRKMRPYLRL